MPLYEYRCTKCGSEWEEVRAIAARETAKCSSCKVKAKLLMPSRAPGVSIFREGWYEHVAAEPIYCRTAQELRDACDENGAVSHYLENSTFRTSPGPDADPECEQPLREADYYVLPGREE